MKNMKFGAVSGTCGYAAGMRYSGGSYSAEGRSDDLSRFFIDYPGTARFVHGFPKQRPGEAPVIYGQAHDNPLPGN